MLLALHHHKRDLSGLPAVGIVVPEEKQTGNLGRSSETVGEICLYPPDGKKSRIYGKEHLMIVQRQSGKKAAIQV